MDTVTVRTDATSLTTDYHGKPRKSKSGDFKNYLGYSVEPRKTSINFLWKNKSSLLFDTDGKMIKSRQALPETTRGINVVDNLSEWKKINSDCIVNLWIDSNDSYSEEIKTIKARLIEFDIRVHDVRESHFFKESLLSKYLDDDESDASKDVNLFDHLIQCKYDWQTIDLLKIVTVLHSLSCGDEVSIFSDLDIKPFSISERFSEESYGHSPINLLEIEGVLVASALIANGKVVPANNFFAFRYSGSEKLTKWFENAISFALAGYGNAYRCMEDSLTNLQPNSSSYLATDKRVISKVPLINIGESQGQKK